MTTQQPDLSTSPFWVSSGSIFEGEPVYFNSEERVIYTWLEGDAEWQSNINKGIEPLTIQLAGSFLEKPCIWEHPSCGLGILPTWYNENLISDIFQYNYRIRIHQDYQLPILCVHYGMFSSPLDLLLLYASKRLRHLVAKQLQQKPCVAATSESITGRIYSGLILQHPQTGKERSLCFLAHDMSAIFGKGFSLKKTCDTLLIPLPYKSNMEASKSNMRQAYIEQTEDFIDYALGDLQAKAISQAYTKLIHQLCQEIGIKPIEISHTLGANVNRITQAILNRQCDQTLDSKNLAQLYAQKPKYLQIKSINKLITKLNEEATASWLIKQQNSDANKYLLSMVDGGYCKNLTPTITNYHELLVDIDIHSCYGNGLLNQAYPIGRPCFVTYRQTDIANKPTLKDFLKSKVFKEAVPGLWYARISTTKPLSFHQDLFLSKIAPETQRKRESNPELFTQESQEILGELILLTTEIRQSALTHDLLQIAMSVMTNKEWSEFSNNVIIDALIYYPKPLQVDTVEQLVQKDLEGGGIETSINRHYGEVTEDKRSHYWLSIPMGNNWIDKLIGIRNNYPKTHPECRGLNEVYKGIINATYGILASPYYHLSNVVVANNITARARGLAWMMAKALGMNQVITDGGVFRLNKVNHWTQKKPGLNTLTLIEAKEQLTKEAKRHLKKQPLGGLTWQVERYQQLDDIQACEIELKRGDVTIKGTPDNYPLINQLVAQHLQNFFTGDIDLLRKSGVNILGYDTNQDRAITEHQVGQFSFEVKDIYVAASYHSTSNYLLERVNGTFKIKTRAYQWQKPYYVNEQADIIYQGEHPIVECLKAIKEGKEIPAFPQGYTPTIITANAYRQPSLLIKQHYLLPGETTTVANWLRPISVSMFRWQNLAQYRAWTKRHLRLRKERGYGLELYFLNEDGSVKYQEAVIKIQSAIDEGKLWIVQYNNPDPDGFHPFYANTKK